MVLTQVQTGSSYRIHRVDGSGEARAQLMRLGFVPGENITVVSKFADNLLVSVKDSRVALDAGMAGSIVV